MDDGRLVDVVNEKIMKCIVYYNEATNISILTQQTRCWKGLVIYFKSNNIIAMKKHVDVEHLTLLHKLSIKISNIINDC